MIIGIAGLIGSGKDTAADYLCTTYGFKRMSFADSLKEAVSIIFGWDYEMLKGSTKTSREQREEVDHWWAERLNIPKLTPRWILQQWGTEVARKGFHDDIWVASLENKLRNVKDNIVITDCRFPNEFKAIKSAGGINIRTHRGIEPNWIPYAEKYNKTFSPLEKDLMKHKLEHEYNVHASEYSSIGLDYDFQLDNNKTITELHSQIEDILLRIQ